MSRNGLSLPCRTNRAQKNPEQIIDKVISYILHVRQLIQRNNYDFDSIIAMDETGARHEMISNNTVIEKGAKFVVWKTSGCEKAM